MAEERMHYVVYVETSRSEADVRKTFSECGEIRGIYPWKTGDHRASTHFFVEFKDDASVKRARALPDRDYKAHRVAHSPQMVAHFETVSRYDAAATPPACPDPPASLPQQPSSGGQHISSYCNSPRRKSTALQMKSSSSQMYTANSPVRNFPPMRPSDISFENKENIAEASPSSTLRTSSGSFEQGPSTLTSFASTFVRTPYDVFGPKQHLPSSSTSARIKIKSEPELEASSPPARLPSSSQPPAPESAQRPIPLAAPPAMPSPVITLSYSGQSLDCELDSLTDDPASIIFTLSQAAAQSAERDKWMIVAGYYRGKRSIRAAISVVAAMVDVMMSPTVGLTKEELKPAFLMLASCYTDLSREARQAGPESAAQAKEHMEKAKEFFQMVYGTHVPTEEHARTAPFQTPQRLSLLQRVERRPVTSPDDQIRIRTIEREIQSLRDKQNHQLGQLADARAAKRKLEENLDEERTLRRKAERDFQAAQRDLHAAERSLGEANGELHGARRSAKHALEQCKHEVENRRRVEERTTALRDELEAAKCELTGKLRDAQEKDRKARECFAKLGVLFTKAAQGELEDPTSPIFAGPSRSARASPPLPPTPRQFSHSSTRAVPPPPPTPGPFNRSSRPSRPNRPTPPPPPTPGPFSRSSRSARPISPPMRSGPSRSVRTTPPLPAGPPMKRIRTESA